MSTDTERLFVQLEARITDFERRMRQAERRGTRTYSQLQRGSRTATRGMERDMVRSSSRINAALATTATTARTVRRSLMMIGGPILGAAGGFALARGIRGAVSNLSDLGKAARDVSMDVEELQGLMRGFERETRVSGEQATQAFERFNRRVGEAAEGQGELNRVVERYGIRLRDANGQLRDQGSLLREVANAIRDAGTDQERAAIAQAAFGDVGRQMAAAMREGSASLDRMIRQAREAGDVIDRDMVARAEELDDRFNDVTHTLQVGFVRAANRGLAAIGPLLDVLERVADRRTGSLADVFGSDDEARGLLGRTLFDAIDQDMDVIQEHLRQLGDLARAYEGLSDQATNAGDVIQNLTESLIAAGETNAARMVGSIAEDVREAVREFQSGEKTAEEFRLRIGELTSEVDVATSGVEALDDSKLTAVKAQFGGLILLVDLLSARVADLRDSVSGIGPARSPVERRANLNADMTETRRAQQEAEARLQEFIDGLERQRNLTTEQIALEREKEQVRRDAAEAGVAMTEAQIEAEARLNMESEKGRRARGGGGGAAGGSAGDLERAVQTIRERTAALEAEAEALILAAESGRDYGQAMQYAQARARLINAAISEGLAITPELEAAIDGLADAYARAGDEARNAAESMREAEDNAERGARAMADLFSAMIDDSRDASDVLRNLLLQIAQIQMQKAFMGLADSGAGGGFFSWLGGLLGMSGGGYTGDGGKYEPKGVVHGGEFVFSKRAVQRIGVDQLESLHRNARGFAQGGFVGPSSGGGGDAGGGAPGGRVEVVARVEGGSIIQTIERVAGDVSARTVEQYDRDVLPDSIEAYQADPWRRG